MVGEQKVERWLVFNGVMWKRIVTKIGSFVPSLLRVPTLIDTHSYGDDCTLLIPFMLRQITLNFKREDSAVGLLIKEDKNIHGHLCIQI
jgi:hypothetical protein